MNPSTAASGPRFFRRCPHCGSLRPAAEAFCENRGEDATAPACNWPLDEEALIRSDSGEELPTPAAPAPAASGDYRCVQGHPMDLGDQLCLLCGAEPRGVGSTPELGRIDGWVLQQSRHADDAAERFLAREEAGDGTPVELTLYRLGAEPDPAVQDVLRRMPADHVPRWLAAGRHEGRAYEVTELIQGGTLADSVFSASDPPELLHHLISEIARALESFAELSLRHRDLHPGNILVRSRDPVDLVITGFGSARLADFDLEAVAPLELTRYSAPEAIVGAVSAASDWWSLGMIVLELATAGGCFAGIHDQAFRLQVVTRGCPIPRNLEARIHLLLRGLLVRDPLRRWSSPQVRAWLAGEDIEAPPAAGEESSETGTDAGLAEDGEGLTLAGRILRRPEVFALTAAEGRHWEAAKELTLRGSVATWLARKTSRLDLAAEVRRLLAAENLGEDHRHALILMVLNPDLPLILRGEIVTPAWLLTNRAEGYEILTGELSRQLERLGRESWLLRLRNRAGRVRERAKILGIELDETSLRITVLASSRANLEAERDLLRRIYPDTDHPGLASLLDRNRLSDEDLIVLLTAGRHQFRPLEAVVAEAEELARRCEVPFDPAAAVELLQRPRRQVFDEVDQRTAGFSRCGRPELDSWADTYRVERRIPLHQAAVLLALPRENWLEPPQQQYIANLLECFEKRVVSAISRGPLARFTIGKWTPRIDLFELGTGLRPAEALLNHLLSRDEAPMPLDPEAYREPNLAERLRRLVYQSANFRRDTGLDGRMLAFPFLLLRDARDQVGGRSTKTRQLPLLLWPITFEVPPSLLEMAPATLMFDREREEVRLNPALEGLLPPAVWSKLRQAREEMLARSAVRCGDVIDIFSSLAKSRGVQLGRLCAPDTTIEPGACELVPAAALFNAEFTGQSVAEDLRRMRKLSPAGTGLEAILRITTATAPTSPNAQAPSPAAEKDRYLVVDGDPSQDLAVHRSRSAPGLLVEGPPGTGKSQTIVNVIADSIGRQEAVLVVCQKQAALQVVKKRLEAEGLGDRLFMVVDINKDREQLLRSLREQLGQHRRAETAELAALQRKRNETAFEIEKFEGELDRHHEALHTEDETIGVTYRELLGELLVLEDQGAFFSLPPLQLLFAEVDRRHLRQLSDLCATHARLWLDAAFEQSPLAVLAPFPADATVANRLAVEIQALIEAEKNLAEIQATTGGNFEVDDPAPLETWLRQHSPYFRAMNNEMWARLPTWRRLFQRTSTVGRRGLETVSSLASALDNLPSAAHDEALFSPIAALTPAELEGLLGDAQKGLEAVSFFGRLAPSRFFARRRLRNFLGRLGEATTEPRLDQLRSALTLEHQLRPQRQSWVQITATLGLEALPGKASITILQREVALLLPVLKAVADAAEAVENCPRTLEAERMAEAGRAEAFEELRRALEGAMARQRARQRCHEALRPLQDFLAPEWQGQHRESIDRGQTAVPELEAIWGALGTLEAFQKFRSLVPRLGSEVLRIFERLRDLRPALHAAPPTQLEELVRRTVWREVLLAKKARIERLRPELDLQRADLAHKVAQLGALDTRMRELNRQVLASTAADSVPGSASEWEDLTRLRGPRRRSLREVLERGRGLGLFRLRPIWLMNPDVASRILPLEAGLFDLVIYDEASQMPVEHALPTLLRARRILISGDEKQMPPTRFFTSSFADDAEDNEEEPPEDTLSEPERQVFEARWKSREIKDCPDLLQAGRSVLPHAPLEIHYRSQYRELIQFSNAAFYGGNLHVPVRHPQTEVLRARPIEVVRIQGIYENQTNAVEAEKVIDYVAEIWATSAEPPSLGVVTFNRHQADLIQSLMAQRWATDDRFLQSYLRERERFQQGEDMSFFIKNVENVQGDERDIILFSTTFGLDRHGTFKRQFGVLGQAGGERRLNVAITRARHKVVLITSMPLNDIADWLSSERAPSGPRDYLQAYLDYAERVSSGNLAAAAANTGRLGATAARRAVNWQPDVFGEKVGEFLTRQGWNWVRASDGDVFGIDFAIEDPGSGLFAIGIECDAPRQALLARARAREIWRPSVLRKQIRAVHRVSTRDWYENCQLEGEKLREAVAQALAPAAPKGSS